MRERGHGDPLDVLRRDEVAAEERGPAPRELEQRERAARARADLDLAARPRRGDEIDDVVADRLGHVDLLDRALHRQERLPVDDALELDVVARALETPLEHPPLVLALGIADAEPDHEAVELRFGQRVRPLVLDRVLRRDHEERRLERMRRVLDRHLPLGHRLEQRGLRLRRSAVDLVAEEQVREDRAGTKLEVARALVVHRGAGDVGGHQVGRELDPLEAHVADLRERARDQRLGESRVVLEQHVSVGEEREQARLERAALADDRLLDLVEDPLGVLADLVDGESLCHRPILSISSTRVETSSSGGPAARRSVGASQSGRTTAHRRAGIRSSA